MRGCAIAPLPCKKESTMPVSFAFRPSLARLVAGALVALAFASPSRAQFQLNSTADVPDATPGDGLCSTLGGDCTLRAAVEESNANPGLNSIHLEWKT